MTLIGYVSEDREELGFLSEGSVMAKGQAQRRRAKNFLEAKVVHSRSPTLLHLPS